MRYPNLKLISFVGVDEKTDFQALHMLGAWPAPEIEFSVLFSYNKSGGRYSSLEFCHKFFDFRAKMGPSFSRGLHLCGEKAIRDFLNAESEMESLAKKADAIQLNFSSKKFEQEFIVYEVVMALLRGHNIILQQKKSNADIIRLVKEKKQELFTAVEKAGFETRIRNAGELRLLYDSSGGFGKVIQRVESPDADCFTGYAGGLNPENVVQIVEMIQENNSNGRFYYIDMESGVRTEEVFDVGKCTAVVEALSFG
jgi:phosphoribosylanthranilate isomerase